MHGTISVPGKTPTSEEISNIEGTISVLLKDSSRSLQTLSTSRIASELEELGRHDIRFVGASPTGSIIMFFLCPTFQSVVSLKAMVESGCLKEIMERVFNLVLESSTIRVELELSYNKDQFKDCIDEARRTSE